jgi:hypothetical protein
MPRPGRWLLLVALVGACAGLALGDERKTNEVSVSFHDGTVVRKATILDDVEIQTRFGKLSVPVRDIRRIEFGLHLSSETSRQLEEAVRQLGSDKYEQRQAASKQLVALGFRAWAALEAAVKDSDKEVATRAQAALEQIREETPEEQLNLKPDDVIYTGDCVLTGRITTPVLKARADNFGEVQFKLADLRSLRSAAVSKVEVTLDAAQHALQAGKWLDTGLVVEADSGLSFTASGQVDLAPQQAGQVVSGPEGFPNGGNVNGHSVGMLLGRIGDKGEPFLVGKRLEGRTVQEGKLYLQIVTGQPATGGYKVRVLAGAEVATGKASLGSPAPLPGPYALPRPSMSPLGVPPGVTAPAPLPPLPR